MLERNFELELEDMGPYTPARFPTVEQIEDGREGVSNTYATFIETRGYGLVRGGRYQFCPADQYRSLAALIFKADTDFSHKDTRILGFDAFGMELVAWSEKHNTVRIDLLEYQIRCMSLAKPVLNYPMPIPKKPVPLNRETRTRTILPTDEDTGECWDWQENRMYEAAVRKLGQLEFGEVYGFVPSLGLTGYNSRSRTLDNVQRVKALEHFCLIAQLKPFHLVRSNMGRTETIREIG